MHYYELVMLAVVCGSAVTELTQQHYDNEVGKVVFVSDNIFHLTLYYIY